MVCLQSRFKIVHDVLYGQPPDVSTWQKCEHDSDRRATPPAEGAIMASKELHERGEPLAVSATVAHLPTRRGASTDAAEHPPFLTDGALPSRQVLADSVYDVVKQQIMDLKLAPSTRLNIDQLARELEVSNTPLREALARLEAEGLVVRRSLRGFTVSPVPDLRDVDELFELRLMLEPGAARLASKRVGPGDLALLRSSVERMVELAGDDSETGHYRRHRSLVSADAYFHDFIAEASGNKLLRRTVSGLHAHTTHYRAYFKVGYAPEGGDTADEHAAIVDALAQRNASQAAQAMRDHIRHSHDRLRRVYRLNAEKEARTTGSNG